MTREQQEACTLEDGTGTKASGAIIRSRGENRHSRVGWHQERATDSNFADIRRHTETFADMRVVAAAHGPVHLGRKDGGLNVCCGAANPASKRGTGIE